MPESIPLYYVNQGRVLLQSTDMCLRLGCTVGDEETPMLTLCLSLSFAAHLWEVLGAALTEAASAQERVYIPHIERQDAMALPARFRLAACREEVLLQRQNGASLRDIAGDLQVGMSSLCHFLQEEGVVSSAAKANIGAHATTIWALRREGQSMAQIAHHLHINTDSLSHWCRRHPVPQEDAS